MPKIFISHSRTDRTWVKSKLITYLEARGMETWLDEDDIKTADYWERSIINGLRQCEWFLVVMSPESAKSEWVKDEINWAIDNRPVRIIPVMKDLCDPRDFHIRLARIQYADFHRDESVGYQKLGARLELPADPLPLEPPEPHGQDPLRRMGLATTMGRVPPMVRWIVGTLLALGSVWLGFYLLLSKEIPPQETRIDEPRLPQEAPKTEVAKTSGAVEGPKPSGETPKMRVDRVSGAIETRYWQIINRAENRRYDGSLVEFRTNVLRQAVFLSFPESEADLDLLREALTSLKTSEAFRPEVEREDLNVDRVIAELKSIRTYRRDWLKQLSVGSGPGGTDLPRFVRVDPFRGEVTDQARSREEIERELTRLSSDASPGE